MADPYESPEHETPVERRARLLNLTNPAWQPESEPEEESAAAPESEAGSGPAPGPRARSGKDAGDAS